MTFLGTINIKILKRKRSTFDSYSFTLIKNRRNRVTGKASFDSLIHFGSLRSYELADEQKTARFWAKVNLVLEMMVRNGQIYSNDRQKITDKISAIVPIPAVQAPLAEPKTAADRVNLRFKHLIPT